MSAAKPPAHNDLLFSLLLASGLVCTTCSKKNNQGSTFEIHITNNVPYAIVETRSCLIKMRS
jgi:hypothetical protein